MHRAYAFGLCFFALSCGGEFGEPYLVKNIGVGWIGVQGHVIFRGRAVFPAERTEEGSELWTSDGTPNGTFPIIDLWPGAASSGPADLVVAGDRVFFTASHPLHGRGLWITDGTAGGTRFVSDFGAPSQDSAAVYWAVALGTRAVLMVREPVNGVEPWVSDGTAAGTRLLKDIWPGPANTFGGIVEPSVAATDQVYFMAIEPATGTELWTTDGTPEGTRLVRDVAIGPDPPNIGPFFQGLRPGLVRAMNGRIYWRSGGGIWVLPSDGIPRPAWPGFDVLFMEPCQGQMALYSSSQGLAVAGPLDSSPAVLAAVSVPGGFLRSSRACAFQCAGSSVFACILDQTGYRQVALNVSQRSLTTLDQRGDLSAGGNYFSQEVVTAGGRLYFAGVDPTAGGSATALWSSDGTAAGTHKVSEPAVGLYPGPALPGLLFFSRTDSEGRASVWAIRIP